MPPKKDELKKEAIIGIVVGTVVGTGLLLALFMVFRQRRRERRLRLEFEKAAIFGPHGATAACRTKSIGTQDEEMSLRPSSIGRVSRSISGSRYSEAPPYSAISELNPYNYRMRPELATIESWSSVELVPDKRALGASSGPHELEAGVVTFPSSARVANHVLGESDGDAESPILEMKELKI
ncbi:hypothetical protein AC579_1946 [Pseudocercospora musae]|uniref:Uncharacterized protein n=1 Tax=Pseudocercospora musae TaxID=113226 RepID=A0A139I7Z3_9PEZI|nr:hypothetical protein AC579_1946 [Pseudocercospora musae]